MDNFPRSQHYTPAAELLEHYTTGFTSRRPRHLLTLDDHRIVQRLRERYATTPAAAERQGQRDADALPDDDQGDTTS
jgi:hypothetical protein